MNIDNIVAGVFNPETSKKIEDQSIYKDIYTAKELRRMNIKQIPFLLDGIIPQVGLSCLTGSSDCNKSTLLRQLAIDIAVGKDSFLGFKLTPKHRNVIYVSTEDDCTAISAFTNMQYPNNLSDEILDQIHFIFNKDKHIDLLKKLFAQHKFDLVIIDGLTDMIKGDLNQTTVVRSVLNVYNQLSMEHRCAFIFVHHQGKRTEDNAPSKNNLLGSQGIEAKMRAVIELRRDTGNRRLMTITKGNYSKDSLKGKSFVLELQENTMLFQRRDEAVNLNASYGFGDLKIKYSKEDIMKVAVPLRAGGLSFEKLHTQITEQFGKDAPGLTTLKTWFKGQSDSQSPSK
jgi:RecA-family ATPase